MSFRVSDYMQKDVVCVTKDEDLTRAVYILVSNQIAGVPVVNSKKQLLGILTERDCISGFINASYFDERGGTVKDFMAHPVETISPTDSLIDAAIRFRDSSHRRFPVVAEGVVVGILSRRDVLRFIKDVQTGD